MKKHCECCSTNHKTVKKLRSDLIDSGILVKDWKARADEWKLQARVFREFVNSLPLCDYEHDTCSSIALWYSDECDLYFCDKHYEKNCESLIYASMIRETGYNK